MKYFEVYKKRLNRDGDNLREKREKDSRDTLDRNFNLINGYKKCLLLEPEDVNINFGIKKPFDVVVKSGTEELKKDFMLRPNSKVQNGSYITIDGEDRTYIVNITNYDGTLPVAHCYLCNEKIRLKGCPVDFPIYENSTTFGTKGIVDNGGSKFLELDSKTRAYLQYNKFTERIPLGYRFIFKNRYVFSVTEIDHMVYEHLIVTMKITEKHPNDDFENNIAWNEQPIDFSDLLQDKAHNETLHIDGSSSVRVGKMEDYFINWSLVDWSYSGDGEIEIVSQDEECVTILGVKKGIVTLSATTSLGIKIEKNIFVI